MSKQMTLEGQIDAAYAQRADRQDAINEVVATQAAYEICCHLYSTLDDDTAPHASVDSPEDEDREEYWLKLLLKDAKKPGNQVIWLA